MTGSDRCATDGGKGGWRIPISVAANRWLHAGAGGAMATVLLVCAVVEPSIEGRGTHRRLGLPSCLVCLVSGRERCPSCGMTTAFCHAVRGRFGEAERCHAAALYAFGLWLVATAYCALIAVVGKQWLVYELLTVACVAAVLLGFWLAAW